MIEFHSETDFELLKPSETSQCLEKLIVEEKKGLGDINIIFCSDEYLLEMNVQYLEHDYYTDIITFNYNQQDEINGDLFISIDRVKDNAEQLQVDFRLELNRVMVHGLLHLVGYNDKTDEEQKQMRHKEDYYLNLHSNK